MKLDDLRILIREVEGTTLEFKESLSASLARDRVAMANAIGGRILLGVRNDGTVVGMKDSNGLRARIQGIARNGDPLVQVVIEVVCGVVVVHVCESRVKPVQCGDAFFWAQGAASHKLSRNEIHDFFRAEGAIRFDTGNMLADDPNDSSPEHESVVESQPGKASDTGYPVV